MSDRASDAEHFLRRAEEEARLALAINEPAVAAAHQGLSIQYAARARRMLQAEQSHERSAFTQFGQIPRRHHIDVGDS